RYADHAEAHDKTLQEIVAERAAALSRVSRGLERRIGHARALRREAQEAPRGPERERRAHEFNRARKDAATWLWYLIVQREANGLTDHSEIRKLYPLPEPWTP
ncbi:MAG: hypothetical protein ACLF0P_14105, partial [Thermoanaerobaculia bacterium]